MIDEILITLSESGGLVANKYTLTMEGENNSKGIVAFLPEKLSLYSFYIEFQKADGEKVTSKRLIPAEKDKKYFISYELSKPVLNVAGLLTVQFVARNESGVEWKSDTGEFFVKTSINAVEEIVETSSDLLADLQGQLDGKQDELIAGNNIELVRKGEKVEISVPEEIFDIKIDNAVKSLMGGEVDEAYDTFKEIQELLESDKVATEALIKKVNDNATEITKLKDSIADGAVNEEKVKEIVEDTIEEKELVSASEVDEKIDLTIGDINSILQTINGGIGAMLDEINGEVL
jgi:hypothetical protein